MFDVLKGEGLLCFLEGPLGSSVFPNASTKLLSTCFGLPTELCCSQDRMSVCVKATALINSIFGASFRSRP